MHVLHFVAGHASCNGKYDILHAPKYMTFLDDKSHIDLSEIPIVIKNAFGFSIESVSISVLKANNVVKLVNCKQKASTILFNSDQTPFPLGIKL